MELVDLAEGDEVGQLGVRHLKRFWSRTLRSRSGEVLEDAEESHLDRWVMDALGIGWFQALSKVLMEAPSFAEFEEWIATTAEAPDEERIRRMNACHAGEPPPPATRQWLAGIEAMDPVLSSEDLAFWEENGFVVLSDAVTPQGRAAAEQAIWDCVGADPEQPESWYTSRDGGIMVELIQHAALEANRRSERIHKAFSQLWGATDLWVTADRCGFHPPQTDACPFPGPDLHWDLDLAAKPSFATQGILYLTDTASDQGALTVVPGFHKRLSDWLAERETGSDPQSEDLHALGSKPVAGRAGDLVIWNHALPHGSRPNLGTQPRIVQYLNFYPGRLLPASGSYSRSPMEAPL